MKGSVRIAEGTAGAGGALPPAGKGVLVVFNNPTYEATAVLSASVDREQAQA